MKKVLPQHFYERDTHVVAQELLGKILVRHTNNITMSGRITEVEAYIGEDDLACHASRGRTPRTEIMFGQPGRAYVYLIYGMYRCLNIVTEQEGFPAAILLRSLEPVEGQKTMQENRSTERINNLTTGPGKLCQALGITKECNGIDMTVRSNLFVIDDGFKVPLNDIATSPRIGVAYAQHCAEYPWRYYLRSSPFISRP